AREHHRARRGPLDRRPHRRRPAYRLPPLPPADRPTSHDRPFRGPLAQGRRLALQARHDPAIAGDGEWSTEAGGRAAPAKTVDVERDDETAGDPCSVECGG